MENASGHGMAGGHMAIEKLMNTAKATHVAVKNGRWSDPSTWQGNKIPTSGANVLINKGTTVLYDQVSEARLKTISVKGKLKFATGTDTKLLVETILNGPGGKLDIGSAQQAVMADKQAQIIFTSDRAVNTKWDPTQLSKGLVSHGEVNIYGADKQDKVRLAKNVSAGDSTLTFKDNLKGWRVGDEIVLAGTDFRYQGNDKKNERFQDEVLTITEITGKQVKFTNNNITSGDSTVLRYDHAKHSKLDQSKIELYAANLSRNVSFETENGKAVPISHRAHVMLMHNPNVNIMNAGFYDLGRSNKSKLVDDVGKNVDGSIGKGGNIRGRYSLHLHQTGLDPSKAIVLKGNAVSGSVGWGIVQHESRAGLEDNVVFDTVGAGIVAESGNETGWWTNNLSIKSTGIPPKVASQQMDIREKRFDLGFEGDGYWIQGAAQIANTGNTAISNNHTGMSLFGGALDTSYYRPVKTIEIATLPANIQKLFAKGQTEADIRHIPTATVSDFEGYNNIKGLEVWGHKTNFDGDLAFTGDRTVKDEIDTAHLGRSRVENVTTWGNLWDGLSVQYSSNIDIKGGIIAGRDDDTRKSGGRGVFVNHATFNSTIDGLTVEGFKQGIHAEKLNSDENYNTNTLQNNTLKNNTYHLSKVGDEKLDNNRPDDFGAFVKHRNNRFEDVAGNRGPVAKFSSRAIGGLSVVLDASAAYDADPYIAKDGKAPAVGSKGIASYGWDVDSNGTLDYFGRTLKHSFSSAGNKKVSLTVLDAQGKATTTAQTINVQPSAYGNAFLGGNFEAGTPVQPESWMSSTQWANEGWYMSPSAQISGGVAKVSKPGMWGNYIGQIVRNEKVHKGAQALNFRLQNVEGSTEREYWKNNEITVKLWGVNGQFDNAGWDQEGPQQVGVLPMQRTELLSENYGGKDGEFFDWKNLSYNVNLGGGYDYLMFQMNTKASADAGDRIAIDNVSLAGKANTVPPVNNPTPPTNPTPPANPTPTNPTPPTKPPISPTQPAPVTPQPNPSKPMSIARLSFDAVKGNTILDTSTQGLSNFGRLRNGASLTAGKLGQGVKLDGKDDIVKVRSSKDINREIHGERTISLWFKADNALSSDEQVLFEEGNSSRGINMSIEDGLLNFGGWNRAESKWKGDWKSAGKVQSGKWNHVALVLDGDETVKNGALTAYLNGRQVGQTQGSQLWKHSELSLGAISGSTRLADGVATSGSNAFAGSIDELQVFNSALSTQQVRQLAIA